MGAGALDSIIRGVSANGNSKAEGAEKSLLNFLDGLESEGKLWFKSVHEDKLDYFLKVYHGMRWSDTRVNPKFHANVIRPTIDRRNALLTENKPNAKILPWRDGLQATATILEKLFDADWHATGMAIGIEEMVQLSSVMGSAGIDLAWNPALRFGEGEIDPVVLDARQVIFDPMIRKSRLMDKASYVRIETVKNVWDLQRDYPTRGMLITPDRSVSTIQSPQQGAGASILQQLNTSFASRIQKLEEGPIPRKIVKEYWIRDPAMLANGQPKWPLGRAILRGGDVVLADHGNPYWDGQWPQEWFDGRPDINSPWGRSEVEALRYIADAINRIGNMFVENSILGGNLIVLTDADAITNETRNKLTNAAALIIPKKFGRSVEYRPPQPMPPHMLQFVNFALRFVDYLLGLNDGQLEGRGRIEMRSGVQLEGLQNASQILVKASARRLEAFMERLGTKWISRIFQFKTGKRLLYYLEGEEYKKLEFSYSKLQTEFVEILRQNKVDTTKEDSIRDMMKTAWRQFAFRVQPFSSLASNKIARSQLLLQLAETGRYPFSLVLKEMGFDNGKELMQMAQGEAAQFGPIQPPAKGKKK